MTAMTANSVTTINPATGEELETYPLMSEDEVFEIARQSKQAQEEWADSSLVHRTSCLEALADYLANHEDRFAKLISQEMGKPVKAARAEIGKCGHCALVYAQHLERWLTEEEIPEGDGKKHRVAFEPLGLVLAVMPWNFPFWQAMRCAIPAIAAGNGVLLKHASNVTGSALAIEECFRQAEFEQNLFRSVVCSHDTIAALVERPEVQGLSLTGSTPAGRRIGELAGRNLKRVVLELGGSDPFVVLDDADVEKAAKNAAFARFQNNGQSCICGKRFVVMEPVAKAFAEAFVRETKKLKVGDPMDEETDIGSLVSEDAKADMEAFVADAREKGARILLGGKTPDRPGAFFEPTIVADVAPEMKVVCEEVFGPIAPILVVKSQKEAIQVANDTPFGLGASVWSKDLARCEEVARSIEAGCVFVNSVTKSDPYLPFGGVKDSGIGRELSHWGLREFVNIKGVNVYDA